MCTILCLPTIPLDQLCFVGRLSGMVASWVLCARACEQHNNWYWPEKKHLKVGEINTFVFSLT